MKNIAYNPYLPPEQFIPDAEPRVFGNRVYIFGSHDVRNGHDYCLDDYVCWSAPVDDLSDWNYEGVIYRKNQDPENRDGVRKMNAPDVVQGPDGRYYLYYVLTVQKWDQLEIAVAVCDTPAGSYEYLGAVRFADGRKMDTPLPFDPAVLVDDDQRIWLYFGFAPHFPMRGQPIPDSMGAYCVELEHDMMTCKREPVNIMPDSAHAAGTEYEAHPFFEAASIRKINGKYYLVYCSRAMHELCYAVSHRPDGDYHFGGIVVSSSDVGYQGRTTEQARNQIANIHGGMFEADGQWYICYHRHTNGTQFCRQGCMERIFIKEDGSIDQAECTSFGASGGSIAAKSLIPGWCACNMYKGQGGLFIKFGPVRQVDAPYVVLEEVEGNLQSYVSNITDDCLVGYRYLAFDGSEQKLTVSLKGKGKGEFYIFLSDEDDVPNAVLKADVNSEVWESVSVEIQPVSGKLPMRFRYVGEGMLELGSVFIQ